MMLIYIFPKYDVNNFVGKWYNIILSNNEDPAKNAAPTREAFPNSRYRKAKQAAPHA